MKTRRFLYATILSVLTILLASSHSALATARCQVGRVAYSIPRRADPGQRIETATTVRGSCVSDGEDYYSVRVDLIDAPSSSIVSSNSTPIGYNATNFTVTVDNTVTTPTNNATWHINLNVYVIRAGGTGGSYLLDYRTTSNATILIGAPTPVPEYPGPQTLVLVIAFLVLALTLHRPRKKETIQGSNSTHRPKGAFKHPKPCSCGANGKSC